MELYSSVQSDTLNLIGINEQMKTAAVFCLGRWVYFGPLIYYGVKTLQQHNSALCSTSQSVVLNQLGDIVRSLVSFSLINFLKYALTRLVYCAAQGFLYNLSGVIS